MINFFKKLWFDHLGGKKKSWVDMSYQDDKLIVKNFNKTFANECRNKLGNIISDNKTDKEVIDIFIERKNINREEPKLEVIHCGIDKDGFVKVELDWNNAFINHLRNNGFSGNSEEDLIQSYLERVSMNSAEKLLEDPASYSKEEIERAFIEITRETESELQEAKKQAEALNRKYKKLSKQKKNNE